LLNSGAAPATVRKCGAIIKPLEQSGKAVAQDFQARRPASDNVRKHCGEAVVVAVCRPPVPFCVCLSMIYRLAGTLAGKREFFMQHHFKIAARVTTVAAAVLSTFNTQAAENAEPTGPEVVVTATRFSDTSANKPINVSVISTEDIRNSTAQTVPELLSTAAGIHVRDLVGNNSSATVDLRGFGAGGGQNTLILLDGRVLTDVDLAGVQWSSIPLANIERIEILRGSGAVLYGGGATGGVINIITRSPVRSADMVVLSGTAGSYGTRQAQILGNRFEGNVGFNVSANHYRSDGYRDNSRNEQSNIDTKLTWLNGSDELQLRASADKQEVRLPGARLTDWGLGIDQMSSDRNGTSTPLDYATRDGYLVGAQYLMHFSGVELALDVSYRNREQTSYFDFSGFPDYRESELNVFAFSPRLKMAHAASGGNGTLIVGMDWLNWEYKLDVSNAKNNIGQPINRIDGKQRNVSLFVQDDAPLGDRLSFLGGARVEKMRIRAADVYDPTASGAFFGSAAADGSQDETQHAAELGLRYKLSDPLALIGKLAHSYRFANIDEIYEFDPFGSRQFQFLKPQTATTVEVGTEYRDPARHLRASLFQSEIRDEIHLDAFTFGVGNTNLPPSRRRGLELDGGWLLSAALKLDATYTFTDAKFKSGVFPGTFGPLVNNDIAGKKVPLVPKHKLNLLASWQLGPDTRLNATAQYVGSQYMDNDEANDLGTKIPAYRVYDLKLDHRIGAWLLAATVNNLFDEKYYAYAVKSQFSPGRFNAYPLPEQNFLLSAEYRFK
jgi:iron complex outermembrane receptor protein